MPIVRSAYDHYGPYLSTRMAAWGHLHRIILKISGPVYSSGSPTGHQRTLGC